MPAEVNIDREVCVSTDIIEEFSRTQASIAGCLSANTNMQSIELKSQLDQVKLYTCCGDESTLCPVTVDEQSASMLLIPIK